MLSDNLLSLLRSQMSNMKVPRSSDKVYKDECLFSFDSPFSDDGLYVNLISLQGFGKDYLNWDIEKRGGRIYLHEKWHQIPKKAESSAASSEEEQQQPTKLAIGVEGGFIAEAQYDIQKEHALVVVDVSSGNSLVSVQLDDPSLPEFVRNVCQGIIDHEGMKSTMQVSSWDADNEKFVSKYANDLVQINPEGKKIPQDPKLWKDEETGATENLWLNLSTGYIGGGRKNWDGSGGSGSSLNHFIATGKKYPLTVKLGTITPHGADVWSYAEDEDALVIDPKLPEHLSFWGIDVMQMQKTEKTLGEMEVALNMSYDWSRIMDGQEQLEAVHGPGFVGLRNIGSSCYMNSVLQSLLAIPEIKERYFDRRHAIVESTVDNPAEDFSVQFSKVATGVLSSRYVVDAASASSSATTTTMSVSEEAADTSTLEKYVVAPRMFKFLVGKNHPEFSSGRQQDVSEYFQYLLDVMTRAERVHLPRLLGDAAAESMKRYTASLFEFHTQLRYQCTATGDVKYTKLGQQTLNNMWDLLVPLDKAVPDPFSSAATGAGEAAAVAAVGDEKEQESKRARIEADKEPEQYIPFAACLDQWLQPENVEMFSPSVGQQTLCSKTVRFATFPRYLMMKMSRYYVGPNWIQKKINARIDVPETLDLTSLKGSGLQDGEREMPDTDSGGDASSAASGSGGGGGATAAQFVIDEGLVAQLTSMGFSENGCRRAAIATNNADAETAMNWVFEHMEDPDFNDPPVMPNSTAAAAAATGTGAGSAVNQEAVGMLTSMGYTTEQVTAALSATDNNIERAADWLFSHAEDLDAAVAAIHQNMSASAAAGDTAAAASAAAGKDDGEGKYSLVAIISHIGKSTDHGHYVCHIKKNGEWVLFNDEKVGKTKKAPVEYGFMYLYRRDDGPGTWAL